MTLKIVIYYEHIVSEVKLIAITHTKLHNNFTNDVLFSTDHTQYR